jgi:hypothetical protein
VESVETVKCKGRLRPTESCGEQASAQELSVIVYDAICPAITEIDRYMVDA